MDEATSRKIPPALIAGRLEGISLPDLLWALGKRRSTGVLDIEGGGYRKAIYLEDGRIVFATSADPDDRLGEMFLRRGLIDLDQLEEAIKQLHGGKRLGTLLVEAGALTPEQLVEGVLSQVEGIVLDMFGREEGEYRFETSEIPTDEVIKLNISTGQLLLRGIRHIRSFSRIRRSVGPVNRMYKLSDGWRDLVDAVSLGEAEQAIVQRLEEGPASLDRMCQEIFLSNFEIYQTIWGLKVIDVVEVHEAPRVMPKDVAFEGSLSQVDFADLLVRLARDRHTGVLHVVRGGAERTFHIAAGKCVFATSNDPDDGLIAHLLRRGVISLAHREETARRLLSNKRVGTILRELGVIDEDDLTEMVCEQLSEIVYGTFRWTDAEYTFVPGSLPSVEEITLEASIDVLVAVGLRRLRSWSRVWRGCGGFEVALELRPSYLEVLDAMGAGPDEWQIITLLKTPQTPREICRQSQLGDYNVCQILWALRVLGAVGPADAAALAPAVPVVEAEDVDEPAPEPAEGEYADDGVDLPEGVEVAPIEDEAGIEDEVVAARNDDDAVDVEVVAPEPEGDADVEIVAAREDQAEGDAEVAEPPAPIAESDGDPEMDDISPEETQVVPPQVLEAALAGAPGEGEGPSPDATQLISREALDAALSGPPEIGDVEPVAEPLGDSGASTNPGLDEQSEWTGPDELEQWISRFNALQRVIYRVVKADVGAGAANFVRGCCADLPLFGNANLQADGSWDAEGLREAVVEQRVEEPWAIFERLVEVEIRRVAEFIGDARAKELELQLDKVEHPGVEA